MAEAAGPEKQTHPFTVSAIWSGDGTGHGSLRLPQADLSIPIGGSKALGGGGQGANAEELLLGAIATCFLTTWAIFLKKLDVVYREPALRVSGELGHDPDGGYKMLGATIHAILPRTLLAEQKDKVEKTLRLAEKYCIVSKVARAAMPVKVEMEEA